MVDSVAASSLGFEWEVLDRERRLTEGPFCGFFTCLDGRSKAFPDLLVHLGGSEREETWRGERLTTSATSETFSFTVLAVTLVERKVRMAMEGRLNMVGR